MFVELRVRHAQDAPAEQMLLAIGDALLDELEARHVIIVERDDLDLVAQHKRHRDRVLAAGERKQRLVAAAFLVGGDQIIAAQVLDGVEASH
jgi:hypothetical protein